MEEEENDTVDSAAERNRKGHIAKRLERRTGSCPTQPIIIAPRYFCTLEAPWINTPVKVARKALGEG